MKILNLGSLNIDKTYFVDTFVQPGETKAAHDVSISVGGKGLNQTVALCKAGSDIWHAGCIGANGLFIKDMLNEQGVHTELIRQSKIRTGEALIQVEASGQNCIILDHGANYDFTKEYVVEVLSKFEKGDLLILQNEINNVDAWIDLAYEKGLSIVLNPSPMDGLMKHVDLNKISYLILNEVEAKEITGKNSFDEMAEELITRNSELKVVLTLGSEGGIYRTQNEKIRFGSCSVEVVDTTSAGDTFLGFFVATISHGESAEDAIVTASKASALAVSRKGSFVSIPDYKEVMGVNSEPTVERIM